VWPNKGVLNTGGNATSHISTLVSNALNSGLDLAPSNNQREDDWAFLNLKEVLQKNQQCSWSHVQKDLGRNEHNKHCHDHAQEIPLAHLVALSCMKIQGRQF
jgi:hypothetical protein